ncbi:MAG: glycosyltransferase family 2 protein [Candidatus Margulisiibacteriota bacterium]
MTTSPLLTIAIPTFNREDTLRQLLSTLKVEISHQPNQDIIEILVVDNASTNYSFTEFSIKFNAEGFQVKFLQNQENLGMDGNFKCCVKNSRGKYMWLISDDDLIVPNAIDHVMNILSDRDNGCIIVNYDVYDSQLQTRLIDSVVKEKQDNCSSVLARSTLISITIMNRELLMAEQSLLQYFDRYLGTYYYSYTIVIFLALKYGYYFYEKSLIRFRSSASSSVPPASMMMLALEPYKIFRDVYVKLYEEGMPPVKYLKKDFIKSNIEPWIKHEKRVGTLNWTKMSEVIKTFGVTPALINIILLYVMPMWFLSGIYFLLKRKRIPINHA